MRGEYAQGSRGAKADLPGGVPRETDSGARQWGVREWESEKARKRENGKTGKRENERGELDLGGIEQSTSVPPVLPASSPIRDLIIAGPVAAPLARAETFYRYQIMLRTRQMTILSRHLAKLTESIQLPDDVTLTVDVDPVNLA